MRPTPAPLRLYERLLAEAVSADTARPAARPGAAQPHNPRARATMHDTADTSRPATGQPSPPFTGPSSDRQRDAQEPHGRPDGPRASHRRHRSTTCHQPRHRPAPSRRHRLRRCDPLCESQRLRAGVRLSIHPVPCPRLRLGDLFPRHVGGDTIAVLAGLLMAGRGGNV